MWFWISSAIAATPFVGLEYTPLSRGDLVWTQDDRVSGVAVGEFDGIVRPSLSAFGGAWFGRHLGLSGGIGIARLQNTTWVEDTWRQRHWGVVRPHLDLRISPAARVPRRPFAWLALGAHGAIPSARDASNAYSEEETTAASQVALQERASLGGFGLRGGGGVELHLIPQLSLGAQYMVEWHRNLLLSDDGTAVSSFLSGRASLLLTIDWGPSPLSPGAEPPAEESSDDDSAEATQTSRSDGTPVAGEPDPQPEEPPSSPPLAVPASESSPAEPAPDPHPTGPTATEKPAP